MSSSRAGRHRLGTDDQRCYFADHIGRVRSMVPRQVVSPSRPAAGGSLTVMQRTGHGKPLYAEEDRRGVLLGAQQVGEWAMRCAAPPGWHRHPSTLATIAAILLARVCPARAALPAWGVNPNTAGTLG